MGDSAAGGNAIGQGANVPQPLTRFLAKQVLWQLQIMQLEIDFNCCGWSNDVACYGAYCDGYSGYWFNCCVLLTVQLLLESAAAMTLSGGAIASCGFTATAGTPTATGTVATASTISTMNVLTAQSALKALDTIDGALQTINSSRASLGALQNRFSSVVANQQTTIENLSASRGRIQDADFAKETANLSRSQVLQQAGTAMLSQANQSSQGVLSLLR